MAKKKKRRNEAGRTSQEEAERQFTLRMRRMELAEKLGTPAVWFAGIGVVLYVGVYMPIEASHGETTTITFILDWIAYFKINVVLAWSAAAGCAGWAIVERKKRLRERKERDDRIKKLEMQIDPNRSSSNLTTDGSQSRKAQNDE